MRSAAGIEKWLRSIAPGVILLVTAAAVHAQGGKAEPKRIEFAPGRAGITLSGSLSNGQEMEYVFTARKGQRAAVRISNSSLFDYRIFNPDADFETEFESSPSSVFELPADGDYFLFVRKKMVQRPRTARFSLTLTVK